MYALKNIFKIFKIDQRTVLKMGSFSPTISILFKRQFSTNIPSEYAEILGRKEGTARKADIDNRAQKRIDDLIANNPEASQLLKMIELEIEVNRQNGEKVPEVILPRYMYDLLKASSRSQRRKLLEFLWINERRDETKKEEQKEKQEILEKIREERKAKPYDFTTMEYGFGKNFLLRRILDPTMNNFYNWNALKATMYGNKIILDFSFENNMNPRELKSCAKQIMVCFATNRKHNFPFHMYFCNVNMSGPLIENLHRYIPVIFDDDFPVTITEKSYLDMFPKQNLVYLTSNTDVKLSCYNQDDIYIIGALVDKVVKDPVSMAKAKREQLRMAKLPLDNYLQWGGGSNKDLPVNQVVDILLDLQVNDWEYALRHVPRRKLEESRRHYLRKRIEKEILKQAASDYIKPNFKSQFNPMNSKENATGKLSPNFHSRKKNLLENQSMMDKSIDFNRNAVSSLRKQ